MGFPSGGNSVLFPLLEAGVHEERLSRRETPPNRFIHLPLWMDEFGRWVRECCSEECCGAYEAGAFDEDAEMYFHEGRSPIYAYFKLAKPYDWERGL